MSRRGIGTLPRDLVERERAELAGKPRAELEAMLRGLPGGHTPGTLSDAALVDVIVWARHANQARAPR